MRFEEYLQQEFEREHPEILDDDLPDAYEAWVTDLDQTQLIELADMALIEAKNSLNK